MKKKRKTSLLPTSIAMLCPRINNNACQSFNKVSLTFPFAISNMMISPEIQITSQSYCSRILERLNPKELW